jgi:hypothetical protein
LFLLILMTLLSPVLLTVANGGDIAQEPPLPPMLDCNDIATLPRNEPFARGALKAVEWSS